MHRIEHALLALCIGSLIMAQMHAAGHRMGTSFAFVAAAFALIDAAVILGGMPLSAEIGIGVMAAGFALTALHRSRRDRPNRNDPTRKPPR